jgi:flagellar biosynthesis protein FlhG
MIENKDKFWAVGGGKGGVGKTVLTLLLGTALARQGKKVVLVDADLGGGNLHTLIGIRHPKYTLADFILKKVETLNEIMIDTPEDNLKLICGADNVIGLANPKATQKTRIFSHLKKLASDIVLLDLGSGNSYTSLDFFLFAANKIVVLTPQAPSLQNAYTYIKAGLYRTLTQAFAKNAEALEFIRQASCGPEESIDSMAGLQEALHLLSNDHQRTLANCISRMNIKLLVNMVTFPHERNVNRIIKLVAKNFLGLDVEDLGSVPYDQVLHESINKMTGILNNRKEGAASNNLHEIAAWMLNNSRN